MSIDAEKVIAFFKKAEAELSNIPYSRPALEKLIPENATVLEIGAGTSPLLDKNKFRNYRILDFYTTEELFEHLKTDYNWGHISECHIPEVDYVCRDGNIPASVDSRKFDIIFSSHAIEHQPCLIKHLNSLEETLAPNGLVVLIIPDRRCTFDYLRQVTTTSDVLTQFHTGRGKPGLKGIFDANAYSININPIREITRDDPYAFSKRIELAYKKFLDQIMDDSKYEDIHNWVFTPNSFAILMTELFMLGLTGLFPQIITKTVGNDFTCILNRQDSPTPSELALLENYRLDLHKSA